MVETLNANVPLEKTRIISVLKQKGPSVANAIAKTLGLNNILASAILSEMTSDKTLKSSNLKVGGSPLYYIQGQEMVLENFVNYLEHKEREAFAKLKAGGILMDSELEPAIRVALRNIKDFAVPLKVNSGNQDRIVWKYFMLKKEDAEAKLEELFSVIKKSEQKEKVEEKPVKIEEKKAEKIITEKKEKPKERKARTDIRAVAEKWLLKVNGQLKSELMVKNKEASLIISANSGLGKLDFLLIVKDKKNLNEADLALAYKDGMSNKLPVIVLFKGKPSKKLLEYAQTFGGHLILKDFEGNF